MSDNSYQLNIFNFDKEHYKITKPIRLIELFAGIGAQAKALEVLGVPFEHYKICEWAYPSIKAYNSIHLKDFTDYSQGKTKEELIDYLQGNISTVYNTPCDVSKKNEQWLRETYNNCIATHNLMNIMKVKGSDLEIVDTNKYEYVMTYSFPCQDLSLAGTRKGMKTSQADGGTRSGLLWEVERMLDELTERPQILLMENVPEVIGTKNVEHFNKWLAKLEKIGYSNFFQILNAKDYGIPQNRRRCFMLSILGDYAYDFPLKIKLKYRLKDFLEKQVDEKYYLSDKMINYITATGTKDFSVNNSKVNCSTARPITTEQNKRAGTTNYIADGLADDIDLRLIGSTNGHQSGNIYDDNGTAPTLTACDYKSPPKVLEDKNKDLSGGLHIVENTKQGYKIAKPGDGVNLSSRMHHQRGNVQTNSIQTLKTQMEIGVVVKDEETSDEYVGVYDYKESDAFRPTIEKRIHKNYPVSKTLTTKNDSCVVILKTNGAVVKSNNKRLNETTEKIADTDTQILDCYNKTFHKDVSPTITTRVDASNSTFLFSKLRIRKLTPKECVRLMGFEDSDYYAMNNIGLSNSAIYHCAGDSIVTTCLMALLGQMLPISEKELSQKIKEYTNKLVANNKD